MAETLKLQTSRFGELSVDPTTLIRMALPMLGFESQTRFVLIQHKPDSPFLWLQSADDPDLAFILTQPQWFSMAYSITIPDAAVDALEITCAEDVEIYTLVTIPDDTPERMTTNLLGPVVINKHNRKAAQIVLSDSAFGTKTPLLQPAKIGSEPATGTLQWLSQSAEPAAAV
ncbi:MAG: flagellar assembly protein FliW [Vampirovibrionales bacterium]|nr:flagellar assembly protein FliW [Vampirovibrionales bacterium]